MADMDHNEAIRLMAAEKYVLNELEPEARDAFEEHFFGCTECALDVRTGAAFRERCRSVLADSPEASVIAAGQTRRPSGWLQWFRPAIAMPVMAVLLAVVSVQVLVVAPRMKDRLAKLEEPQILPSVSLINVNTRGVDRSVLRIRAGQPFLVFVDIPPDQRISSYQAELSGPDGTSKWKLAISAETARDTVAIRVPAGLKRAGSYTLIVRSAGSKDSTAVPGVEVGRYPFELQVD